MSRLICLAVCVFGRYWLVEGFEQPGKDCSDECSLKTKKDRIVECLKQGKIANMGTFNCSAVNSQGGCDKGQRLVIIRDCDCGATQCVEDRTQNEELCSDGMVAYGGRGEILGSKAACEGLGQGKRLLADLYGTLSCECAVDLGYVDVGGTCYHEHFRGPCEQGQQVEMGGEHGWKCVRNICSQGNQIENNGILLP